MKITPEIKCLAPTQGTLRMLERMAEPLRLPADELLACAFTENDEEVFLSVAKAAGTPLKLARTFQMCVDMTPAELSTLKDKVKGFIVAAYFFRSVFTEFGTLAFVHTSDYPPGYGLEGKAQKKAIEEHEAGTREGFRRYNVLKTFLVSNGKNYISAINKAVCNIEAAIQSTLMLDDLKSDRGERTKAGIATARRRKKKAA